VAPYDQRNLEHLYGVAMKVQNSGGDQEVQAFKPNVRQFPNSYGMALGTHGVGSLARRNMEIM